MPAARGTARGRRARRFPVLLAVCALGVLTLLGASALGYWSTAGTAAAAASTGTLNPPTNVTATSAAGSGSATVSWTASTGSLAPAGYYVVRTKTTDLTTAPACGTSPTSLTAAGAVTCTDTFVPTGTYTYTVTAVTAVSGGWTARSASSTALSVSVANRLAFTTQPGGATGGATLGTQPVVAVQDANNQTVTSDSSSSVTLALTTPNGAILTCGANPKPVVSGVATFAGCKVDKAGTYTLTATDASLTVATSSSFTITVGAATKVAFTTQPGGAGVGANLSTQPVVTVQDAGGNTVTSNTSTVALALTSAGTSTLTCTTATSKAAVAGVAAFSGCKVDKIGTYTLTATDGVLASAVSNAFTITTGVAFKLVFTTQPGGAASQATLSPQPVVAVQDSGGNTVPGDTSAVTLTLTAPNGATLTCTNNPKAAAAGVATFAGCKVDLTGTYTLTATDGALTSAVSSTFTITAGAATKLAFATQPSGGTGGTALATQPVVAVQDALGNTVNTSTTAVTLTLTTPGGATLTCAPNPTNAAAGVATFAGCRVDKPGTYTLTAAATSLTSAASTSFTITVGAASKLLFTTQPANGTSGTALATQPAVVVQDAGGNTVTAGSASVTLALTQGGASLTCTANPATTVAGVATFAGCRVDKTGTYTLTATSASLASAVSNGFTITPGAAAKLAFTTQPSGGTGGTTMATQPVVTVQDAAGNTVTTSTASVTLTLTTPGSATLTCTANPKAAVSGVAAFAGCSVNKVGNYQLTAAATSLTSATSASFTIMAGAATKLMYVTSTTGSTPSCPTGSLAVGNGGSLTTYVAMVDAAGNVVAAPSTATTVTITKGAGGGTAPTPGSLTIAANVALAVTNASSVFTMPNGNPAATTYTATAGALTASCTVSR